MMLRAVAGCLLLVLLLVAVEGKVSKGALKGRDFVYLDKFAFGYGLGTIQFTITENIATPGLVMAFYDDQGRNWSSVYKGSMSCAEKLAMSKPPFLITDGALTTIEFEDIRDPHYWYFVLVACGQSIDVQYDVLMVQESNSKWVHQFSYDDQGLEALYLFYFLVFLFGAAIHGYTIWAFLKTSSYHTLIRIYTFSIALEGASVFCLFVHYAVYADDGVGALGLEGIGELLDMAAQIVFMFLVILIAKGWCISTTNIEGRLVILLGLGTVIITYLAMFIWVNVGLDPASTLYVYETAPGIIIIVVRCLAMLLFLYAIRLTYLYENAIAKRKFYVYFAVSFLGWFLSLPLITIIATGLPDVLRQKVVMILYVTFNAIFLSILGFLLWPTRVNEYFQITARDIGSMPYESI